MGTTITITGAVDRRAPDPTAPNDQTRAWIGMLTARWTDDHPRQATAAICKAATGGGVMFAGWGPHVLILSWIGDQPPPDVARAVFDAVLHRGPSMGPISLSIEATPGAPEGQTYRRFTPSAPVLRVG